MVGRRVVDRNHRRCGSSEASGNCRVSMRRVVGGSSREGRVHVSSLFEGGLIRHIVPLVNLLLS